MKEVSSAKIEYRIVPAGIFKATCLHLLDEVYSKRTLVVIVTKYGKPVAQLTAPPPGFKLGGPAIEDEGLPIAVFGQVDDESKAAFDQYVKKTKKDKKKKRKKK